jgi:hypothetical protein
LPHPRKFYLEKGLLELPSKREAYLGPMRLLSGLAKELFKTLSKLTRDSLVESLGILGSRRKESASIPSM